MLMARQSRDATPVMAKVRVVGEEERAIIDALKRSGSAAPMSLPPAVTGRPRVTTPPTARAKAFGVPIDADPRALGGHRVGGRAGQQIGPRRGRREQLR